MKIYASKGNEQYGPYTMEELRGLVNSKTFASTDFACSDGQNWVKISDLAGWEIRKFKKEESGSGSGKNKISMFSAIGIIFVLLASIIFLLFHDDSGGDAQKELSSLQSELSSLQSELAMLEKIIAQEEAFLAEQVNNGHSILQSNKEAQWKDIAEKKMLFMEIFLDNQFVGLNDENPLESALDELKTSEASIWRGPDYWQIYSDKVLSYKETQRANDNQRQSNLFSQRNQIRLIFAQLYKDRHEKYKEIDSLLSCIVERDLALRQYQNLFIDMKNQKEELEDQSNNFQVKLLATEADLAEEKELRINERESLEAMLEVLRQ